MYQLRHPKSGKSVECVEAGVKPWQALGYEVISGPAKVETKEEAAKPKAERFSAKQAAKKAEGK